MVVTIRHRRDDWGIDDDTWNEGVKRGNFRLHPGALSKGGITLLHASDFAMLHNALLKTPQVDIRRQLVLPTGANYSGRIL